MRQFVIEHGAPGRVAGVATTHWRDSSLPFTPRAIQGYDRHYLTRAEVTCSICGAEFIYKGRRRPRGVWITSGMLLVVVLLFLLCSRLSPNVSIALLLVAGALVLAGLWSASRPREPYLQPLKGPLRFKHRVRPLG